MRVCPCIDCVVFVMCKMRFNEHYGTNSLSEIVDDENCEILNKFMVESNQEEINEGRILFGLEPL